MSCKMGLDLMILEVLQDHATRWEPITREQIEKYLLADYGERIEQRTTREHLNLLMDMDYVGKDGKRYYRKTVFSEKELRVLLDMLFTSRQIPREMVDGIMKKLQRFVGKEVKPHLRYLHYLTNINYTDNTRLPENLVTIDKAIEENHKIWITTCTYDIDKKLHIRSCYEVSPYYTYVDKSRYFLLCHTGRHGNGLEPRRIDRIWMAKISDKEKRKPLRDIDGCEHFELATLTRQPYMFIGKRIHLSMDILRSNIGDFIDWFGDEFSVHMIPENDKWVHIICDNEEDAVYHWVQQYGDIVTVLGPSHLVERLYEYHSRMKEKYDRILGKV